MKVVTSRPGPPLGEFVDVFWYCENPAPGHRAERVMPDGRTALVVNLDRDELSTLYGASLQQRVRTRGIALAGVRAAHVGLDPADQRRILGVHFKAGGMRPFFAPPAGQLADRDVSLDDLWGREADLLHEQLAAAATPAAMFARLEAALRARAVRAIERPRVIANALRRIERAPSLSRVAELQRDSGLSPRRFIALFEDQVGLTPKRYCRIRRFQRVLREIAAAQRVEWAGLAADCGYYDQAHFIRDFRTFSGWNPQAFLAVRGDRIHHIPLPLAAD